MSKLKVFGIVLLLACGCGGENNEGGSVGVRDVYCGNADEPVPDFTTDELERRFCLFDDAQVEFFVKHYSGLGYYEMIYLGDVPQSSLLKFRSAGITEIGELRVDRSKTLESFAGLESVETLWLLRVENASRLTSLSGLENVKRVRRIEVQGNDSLTSLKGLEGVVEVLDDGITPGIFANDNPKLADVSALKGVVRNKGVLSITGSEVLEVIEVGEGLEELRGLAVSNNPKLKAVKGLEGVQQFEQYCDFIDNPSFSTCEARRICALRTGRVEDEVIRGNLADEPCS